MTEMITREGKAEDTAQSVALDHLDVSDVTGFQKGTHLPLFARLRRDDPVHYCADSPFGSYWSITRAADIRAVNLDHHRFSSQHNVIIGDIPRDFRFPAFMVSDPPEHGKWRKVVAPAFSRAELGKLEEHCRQHIVRLLNRLDTGTPIDWVSSVSAQLTKWTVGALFDLKEDEVAEVMKWSDYLIMFDAERLDHPAHQDRKESLEAFERFLHRISSERRTNTARADIFSRLVSGQHAQEIMNDMAHFMGTVSLVVGAGETTRSAASAVVVAMHRYPDQWALLRQHPSLVPNAVHEVIRWQTPLAHMRRTAVEDVEFRGKQIRQGDRVILWYCSGNRDEAIFRNGDDVDITRENARNHLSYGHGIHRCIGRYAAEMQLRILLEESLRRFQTIDLLALPERSASNYFAGFDKLMVEVTPR